MTRSSDSDPTEAVVPIGGVIEMRAGDDLPGFAAVIEDDLGKPIDLTGATCYLILRSELLNPFGLNAEAGGIIYHEQIKIVNALAGVVQTDWQGSDTYWWWPGHFDVAVHVVWPDPGGDKSMDRWLTAPSERIVKLIVRPRADQ